MNVTHLEISIDWPNTSKSIVSFKFPAPEIEVPISNPPTRTCKSTEVSTGKFKPTTSQILTNCIGDEFMVTYMFLSQAMAAG